MYCVSVHAVTYCRPGNMSDSAMVHTAVCFCMDWKYISVMYQNVSDNVICLQMCIYQAVVPLEVLALQTFSIWGYNSLWLKGMKWNQNAKMTRHKLTLLFFFILRKKSYSEEFSLSENIVTASETDVFFFTTSLHYYSAFIQAALPQPAILGLDAGDEK